MFGLFFLLLLAARSCGKAARRSGIVFREGEPFWSTLFADGHVSIVVNSGDGYKIDGLWQPRAARPHAIGAMSRYHATAYGDRLAQVGAWLRPGHAQVLTGVPAGELTDRVVALEDLWGRSGRELQAQIECLEVALLRRLAAGRERKMASLSICGITDVVVGSEGQVSVEELARMSGVSRTHLTRTFREGVGVAPKLYGRLARFRAALRLATASAPWAQVAAEVGYVDQSHMISEFRQFSGFTPEAFVRGRRFHPFQEGRLERRLQAKLPDLQGIHWL
jgi:AraC-like DNA-binding protein